MAINLPRGLTVMAIARSILFLIVLVILPLALSADEKLAKSFTPIWRDAPLTEGDTELERLNRAFVQVADNARPAIVQIRVTAFHEAKSGANPEQPFGSRGSDSLLIPKATSLPLSMSSIKLKR